MTTQTVTRRGFEMRGGAILALTGCAHALLRGLPDG